jgi:hypothetical protein
MVLGSFRVQFSPCSKYGLLHKGTRILSKFGYLLIAEAAPRKKEMSIILGSYKQRVSCDRWG